MNIINWLKKNLQIVIFAGVFSIVNFIPQIFQPLLSNDTEIYYAYNDKNIVKKEHSLYSQEIRRVFNNEDNYSKSIPIINIIPFYIIKIIALSGVSQVDFYNYKNLVFDFFIFIATYIFVKKVTTNKRISIILTLLFWNPFFDSGNLLSIILGEIESIEIHKSYYLSLYKYPNQFNIILYLFAQVILFKLISTSVISIKYEIILTILLIILCFSYPYFYIMALIQIGCIQTVNIIRKKSNISQTSRFLVINLILSLIFYVHKSNFENIEEILQAMYFTKSTNFQLSTYYLKSLFLILALSFCIANKIYKSKIPIYLISLILSSVLPVAVGNNFLVFHEYNHFLINYNIAIKIIIISFFYYIMCLFKGGKFISIIFIIIIYIALIQYSFGPIVRKLDMMTPKYYKVFNYINTRAKKNNTVFYSDPKLNFLSTVYAIPENFLTTLNDIRPININMILFRISEINKINPKLVENIMSNCTKNISHKNMCEYLFSQYFAVDQGSLSYKRYEYLLKEIKIPEINNNGTYYQASPNLFGFKLSDPVNKNPDYVVIKSLEKNNYIINNYYKIKDIEEYSIYIKNQ